MTFCRPLLFVFFSFLLVGSDCCFERRRLLFAVRCLRVFPTLSFRRRRLSWSCCGGLVPFFRLFFIRCASCAFIYPIVPIVENKLTQKDAIEVNHPPTLEHKCCNTVSIYHSATKQARRRMSQSKFAKERKEWLNRPYLNEKATKYNLSSNQDGCRKESYNEYIRVMVKRWKN